MPILLFGNDFFLLTGSWQNSAWVYDGREGVGLVYKGS